MFQKFEENQVIYSTLLDKSQVSAESRENVNKVYPQTDSPSEFSITRMFRPQAGLVA